MFIGILTSCRVHTCFWLCSNFLYIHTQCFSLVYLCKTRIVTLLRLNWENDRWATELINKRIWHKHNWVLVEIITLPDLKTYMIVFPFHPFHSVNIWDTQMCLSRLQTCNNPPYSHKLCFALFYTVTPPLHWIMLWKSLKEWKSEQSKSLTNTTLTKTDLEKW